MTIKRGKITPDLIAQRREAVAKLRLRKLSARKIVEALPLMKPFPILKPDGDMYQKSTVMTDIKALRKEWLANAAKDTAFFAAQLLAETEEVKAAAWAKGDLALVLKAIERTAKMLGVDAPVRREISGPGGAPLEVSTISDEAAQELLDKFRSEPLEEIIDITPISTRSAALGLTLSEEPKNGNGGGNGGGHNGN